MDHVCMEVLATFFCSLVPSPQSPHGEGSVVSFPDPALKEGKVLVHIECFLGHTGCSMSCNWTHRFGMATHQPLRAVYSQRRLEGIKTHVLVLISPNFADSVKFHVQAEIATSTEIAFLI